jgi:arginyl-tRNA synthetase
MAATQDIATDLKSLTVTPPLKKYPNCHPDTNLIDSYRAHITELLHEVTGVDSLIIYPALQWTQTLDKGDLVLPVPALRVKGKKPPELAAEWVEKVCLCNCKQ